MARLGRERRGEAGRGQAPQGGAGSGPARSAMVWRGEARFGHGLENGRRWRDEGGRTFRIIDDQLVGGVGPLLAAIREGEQDTVIRYPATGVHPGGLVYRDLLPPKAPA